MTAINYAIEEDSTARSTANSSYTKVGGSGVQEILGAELQASTDYVLIVSAIISGSSASANDFEFIIYIDGVSVTTSYHRLEPRQTASSRGHQYFFIHRFTTTGTPGDIEFRMKTAGVNTASNYDLYMLAIPVGELTSADFGYIEDTSDFTNVSSVAWVDTAATFTNPFDGTSDYLLCSFTHWEVDTPSDDLRMQVDLDGGSTSVSSLQFEGEDNAEEYCFGDMVYLAAPAATHDPLLQIRTTGDRGDCLHSALFYLRLNAFSDHFGTRDVTGVTLSATATDYVVATATHTTDTTGAQDWIVGGSGIKTQTDNSKLTRRRVEDAVLGVLAGNNVDGILGNGTADVIGMPVFNVVSAVADATSLDIDYVVVEVSDVSPNYDADEASLWGFTPELAVGGIIPYAAHHYTHNLG